MVTFVCKKCGNEFEVTESKVKFNANKYCSRECYWGDKASYIAWNKGKLGWNENYTNCGFQKGNKLHLRKTFTKQQCYIHKGYKLIIAPSDHPNRKKNGYIMEHRLVMEKHLGRYLKRTEVVHHINGDKLDNRIDNLMLFPNNKAHFYFAGHNKS